MKTRELVIGLMFFVTVTVTICVAILAGESLPMGTRILLVVAIILMTREVERRTES